MFKELLVSMRPKQWYKNLVIFIGIVFSLNALNIQSWLSVISAFVIFCILSGSIYTINDIVDKEKDRAHPRKSKRPIASGSLKTPHALTSSVILIIIGLFWSYNLTVNFFLSSVLFLLLNLLYTFWLKKIVIADIIMISINFVVRAIAGVIVISAPFSSWIILCTLFLALLLALGKRKNEIMILGKNKVNHRKTLDIYTTGMLDQMIGVTTASLLVSYSLFTFFSKTIYMMITIPVIIYAVFRYLFLIYRKDIGGEPELIFKDKGMISSIIIWVILSVIILYSIV